MNPYNIFSTNGRLNRKQYSAILIPLCCINILLYFFASHSIMIAFVRMTISLAIFCLSIRRAHDLGYSAWYATIIFLFPYCLIIFCLKKGQPHHNRFDIPQPLPPIVASP